MTSALITITGVENTSSFSLLVGEFLEEIAFVSIEIIQCIRRRGRLDVTEIENRIERFDGYQVLAETINQDVEILTPLRKNKYQKYHCTYMAHKDIDVDVPTYILERTADEKDWDFEPSVVKELYLPSTRENTRTAVFRTTNPWVAEDTVEEFVKQYSHRWQIESQYQVVRQEFWPDIRTHRYASRLFYFAFGCVMQNAWRVADYRTQMEMYGRFDPDERELRAGEFVDFASSYTDD